MNKLFFASGPYDDRIPGFGGMLPTLKELLIVLGALLLVAALALVWAYYSGRQRRRARRRENRRLPRRSVALDAARGVSEIAQMIKERQGRRRRRHRPRNPTLAETGGLPPIRGSNQPPPNPPS